MIKVTSDYGFIQVLSFYVGWKNHHHPVLNENDCGDEIFGLAIGDFYLGYYEDGKWCAGILNENGVLN